MQPLKLPELPDTTDLGQKDVYLILKKRALQTAWDASPYHIEETKETTASDIQRYSDRYRPQVKKKRAHLSTFLKLGPAFFPSELLGQDRKLAQTAKIAGVSQWLLEPRSSLVVSDLQRLDQLASLEQKNQKQEESKKEDGEKEKKQGEEDGDGDGEEIEDEEDEFDDDDYAQNFGFDDDDEYLDLDDGGDDEGATF
eukprot:TRINITY_DN2242_c0_g1_i1.p1 TRINITY_DN2242_c0_g1~~TRINITY_DN2242_c0_g1_i1.p1  ORF type:complete len:197 (-),score=43.25 TRINITY_DN2242_c0_g1_i1:631-1221(-)